MLEFGQAVFEPRLKVGVVEELGVGEPGADDALVAGDDRRAAVACLFIRNENELVDELGRLRVAQHEAFLVVADGGAHHLVRDRQERRVERAHQRHRPFDEAGDFGEQAVVLDQLEALREGEVLGVGCDHLGAARRIEHHLGGLELGDVVVETAHLDRRRRHEAMAAGFVAGFDAVDIERNDLRLLGLRPEGGDDRMQRPHPRQPPRTPAHRLRPRKRAHHLGNHAAMTSSASLPCFSITAT